MNVIKCAVSGCSTQFETAEAVAAGARFICKNHPRSEQVRAAGRQYNPETDHADEEIHFQTVQFDEDLRRAAKPVMTDHIRRQGSETDEHAIDERRRRLAGSSLE